jgi:hypothetical protein
MGSYQWAKIRTKSWHIHSRKVSVFFQGVDHVLPVHVQGGTFSIHIEECGNYS